jgi:Domain of unknown function (DUF4926)
VHTGQQRAKRGVRFWGRLARRKAAADTADQRAVEQMPVATHLEVLSVVDLRVEVGRWPVGTRGTVVEAFDDGALVEISDDRGHTLDMLSLPFDALTVVAPPTAAAAQERLAI